jgi:hypothetical protein
MFDGPAPERATARHGIAMMRRFRKKSRVLARYNPK